MADRKKPDQRPINALDVEIHIYLLRDGVYPIRITLDGQQHFDGTVAQAALASVPSGSPSLVGEVLFRSLIAGDDLTRAWIHASHSPTRRLRLCVDPPELQTLPWECLYDPHTKTFIAGDTATPFSRYIPSDRPLGTALPTPSLRLLVAISAPSDLPPSLAPIDRDAEISAFQDLARSLPAGALQLTILPAPITREALAEALLADHHALHLIAHGRTQPRSGRTVIYLETPDGRADPVPAGAFAGIFSHQRSESPHLIFLGACSSAHAIAPPLIAAGIPAVVAMSDTIRMVTVSELARLFYRQLLKHGQVDLSVNAARAIRLTAQDPGASVPVLYMRLQDGLLLTPPTPSQLTVPLQRPPRPEHFTGREPEITQLRDNLKPGRTVALVGPGGIGKTAIAAELAWRLAPDDAPPARFPDGILFHSFYNRPEIAQAAEHIIKSFVPSADDLTLDALRRILADRRALLILDGTEDADDLPTLLQPTGACAVLITTRDARDARDLAISVPLLKLDEAVQLLRDWGGTLLAAEDLQPQLEHIAALLGRLPLALRIAGRYLAIQREPLAAYIAWLAEAPIDALNPDDAEHREDNVNRLLERSLDQVSDDACMLLSALGVHALAPFDPDLVAHALGLHRRARRRAVNDLVNYSLLTRDGTARVAVTHALIHTYARDKRPPTADILHRIVEAYANRIRTQCNQGVPGYHRLDPDRPHAMRLLSHCRSRSLHSDTYALVGALYTYLDLQGHTQDYLQTQHAGLDAARALQVPFAETIWINRIANAYYRLGQVAQAVEFYEAALKLARTIGDQHSEADALGNLGLVAARFGHEEQAIGYHEGALVIAREIGDRRGEGRHLANLGNAHAALGRVQEALEKHKAALAIAQEIGDRRAVGHHLANLGNAYGALGRPAEAIEMNETALAIAREIGDRRTEGIALGNLGAVYADHERVEEAIECYRAALTIAREIGDRRSEASALGKLGSAHATQKRFEEAIGFYQSVLAVVREMSDRRGEGTTLGELGNVSVSLGRVTDAISFFERAIDILREIGDHRHEYTSLSNLGRVYGAQGRVKEAIRCHQTALEIAREIGDRRAEGTSLGDLGLACISLARHEEAIGYCQNALTIAREIQHRRVEGNQLGHLGLAHTALGRNQEALGYYTAALAISREISDRGNEGTWAGHLGIALSNLGRAEDAIRYHHEALVISREIGDRRAEGAHLGNLGLASAALGRVEEAIAYYQEALVIVRQIGDRRAEGAHLGNLGLASAAQGRVEEAINYHEQSLAIFEEIESPNAQRSRAFLKALRSGSDPLADS